MQLVSLQKSLQWQICQKTNKTISGLHFDIFWYLGDKKNPPQKKKQHHVFFPEIQNELHLAEWSFSKIETLEPPF